MSYYSLENVVYKGTGEVVCVVSPVWLLKSMANWYAMHMAEYLNKSEMDERDVLRGSLD